MKTVSEQLLQIVEQITPILLNLPDEDVREFPDTNSWSKKQILGHLIDSAANNNQRFVRTLIDSPVSVLPYQQEKWVALQGYQEHDWQLLVHLWSAYNRHIAFFIRGIPAAELDRECIIGEKPPVTLGWLIMDYLRHLKDHLRQILDRPELECLHSN